MTAFSKLITDPKRIGLKNENVRVLLDENATLSKIKEAIVNWLMKKVDEKSTVFIFFAGHGAWETDHLSREKDGKASYFLPYDTNRDSLFSSALSSQDLDNTLKMIRSKKLIILLDSCHSGGVASGTRDVKCEEDPYKKLAEGEGRVIITASKPDQLSYEGSSLGHGVFTYHLIEALSGKADTDKNGYVTVLEVFDYLQKNVPASASNLPNGGQQEPMIRNENLAGDFSISINPILIIENEKKSIQDEKIRKLREFHNRGKFSGKQYERLRTIVKTENGKLPEKDLNIGRLIDSFLVGDISIDTFLEDMKDIEPELFSIQNEDIHVKRDTIRRDDLIKDRESKEREERVRLDRQQTARNLEKVKKYCTGCGQQNIREVKFCTKCGANLIN